MTEPNETPEVEETEVEETEAAEAEETEVSDEELLGAIEEELTEEEPEKQDDPEPEPDTTDDGEREAASSDDKDEPEAEAKEPEPEPEPEAEAKPSDEFGTLEDGTPEKTRERFETLKTRYDEIAAERDSAIQERESWANIIRDTGTNKEQFSMALEYLTEINSGTPEGLQKAYDIMAGELEAIGKMLGKPGPSGTSPLDDHPDLKQRVDDGMLDQSDAMEIVEARAARRLSETHNAAVEKDTTHKAAVTRAVDDIKVLGENLKKTDPSFGAKVKMMEPLVNVIIKSNPEHPEQWKDQVAEAYKSLPDMAPPPPPRQPTPDSIRPTATSPSSTPLEKEPGSAVEAIDLALSRGY